MMTSRSDSGVRRDKWLARKAEIEQLVRDGLTNSEIAERYGVSKVRIQAIMRKLGIRRDPALAAQLQVGGWRRGWETWRRNTRGWPPARAELERLVRDGLTNEEIAERYRVSDGTVQVMLRRLGIRRDETAMNKLRARLREKGRYKRGRPT